MTKKPTISPILVGIAGGSCSGKTTLARHIQEDLQSIKAAMIKFDSYYKSLDHIPLSQRSQQNFDCLEILECHLLKKHLQELKAGRVVDIPVYDYKTHTRLPATQRVLPCPVILVEGILLFAVPALARQMDLKIFVDVEADIRLARRLERDIRERGRSVDSVLKQYLETVRPMHEKLVQPSKVLADLIVTGGGDNPVGVAEVAARIRGLLRI